MNDTPDKVSQKDAAWLLRDKYHDVKSKEYEADLARLTAGEPLGYVIGWVPFLGLTITLASHPLIPRPETEWWTEKMIAEELCTDTDGKGDNVRDKEPAGSVCAEALRRSTDRAGGNFLAGKYSELYRINTREPAKILDLCAGSGAIGCAILSARADAHVTFSDNDKAHEATIRANIAANKIDPRRTHVITGDLFDALKGDTFDLIAINPPYIPTHRTLPDEVAHYEPHEALYSGADGLSLLRRIARELRAHLAPQGTAWIEIDAGHASQAKKLFTDKGFTVTLHHDHYGRPRVLHVY